MHDDAFPIAGAKKRQLEFLVSRRVSRIRHGWSAGAILRASRATRNRKPKTPGLQRSYQSQRFLAAERARAIETCVSAQFDQARNSAYVVVVPMRRHDQRYVLSRIERPLHQAGYPLLQRL